jgi:hypothetical protein
VLIVLQGVHQEVPGAEMASPGYTILPPPTETTQTPEGAPRPGALATDADRLRAIYRDVGVEQKHTYGEGVPGSKPPDFSRIPSVHGVPPPNAAGPPPGAAGQPHTAQPGQVPPAQARTVPPNSALAPKPALAAPGAKPKPRVPTPAETSEEPGDGGADAPGSQPAAIQPAPRRPPPPVVVRPHLPTAPLTNQ